MAEDYSDLDPNKVVLSFGGRGGGTQVNIIDKCLEELVSRRREEAAEKAIASTSRVFEDVREPSEAAEVAADDEESDIEIRQVSTPNVNEMAIHYVCDVNLKFVFHAVTT